MDTKYLRIAFSLALFSIIFLGLLLIKLVFGAPLIKTIERRYQIVSCILPPSYFVNQKKQNLINTQVRCKDRTKKPVRKNKRNLISKEAVSSDCKRAYELCKLDEGCYAKGCTELYYYSKGLWQSKSKRLNGS